MEVLQSPRWHAFATAVVAQDFDTERSALNELRGAAAIGLVPELIASGKRLRAKSAGLPAAKGAGLAVAAAAAPWPVLLLRPRGEALDVWVAACTAGAADAAAVRFAAADDMTRRVLDALSAAHAVGWLHCDVRPANIVIVDDCAMLIDWGISARAGARVAPRSVAAYADARLFAGAAVKATPRVDALGALFSWFAVAFGCGCVAPWLSAATVSAGDAAVIAARRSWLARCADGRAGDSAYAARASRAARAVADIEAGCADALAVARSAVDH